MDADGRIAETDILFVELDEDGTELSRQTQQRLWAHFWQIATDADLAESMGVRVAQGEAVYKPVRTWQAFELIVDAVGGMNLVPLPAEAAVAQADG